jgi:DtxR family Mn-dependent transcriptional regulator
MDSWKHFDQNPVTHSVAHHLVAIAELLEAYGYARVSDVARMLEITRGSASITLKSLKNRGLVTEDDRRFLGLSEEGERIAHSIRAKRRIMRALLTDLLGVADPQAEIDTCKIEHLLSDETAERTAQLLEFIGSGDPRVAPFLEALRRFNRQGPADVLSYAAGPRGEARPSRDDARGSARNRDRGEEG